MIDSINEMNEVEEQSSFGIKKILDCKIEDGGRQMYKVKWEPTWEPAENLVGCQHLVDEFWSFVNRLKLTEEVSQQHRKKMGLNASANVVAFDEHFDRLSEENKAEIHDLIALANATSTGNHILQSRSNMLTSPNNNPHKNLMGLPQTLPNNNMKMQTPGQSQQKTPREQNNMDSISQNNIIAKIEDDELKSPKKNLSISSLRYLENFNNPYVKIIVVCKICNKEQSLKFSSNWRHHYITHSDQKPHKCPHCSKGFTHPYLMRNHIQAKHKDMMVPKSEQMMMKPETIKEENFLY